MMAPALEDCRTGKLTPAAGAHNQYLGAMTSPGTRLQAAWRTLAPLPGGRWLFARLLARAVPYSATIRPRVLRLESGHATVEIRERRRLRNHLRSVHAIALANLGELASGLAMAVALPDGVRGIPVRIEVEYVKKARGRITAEGRAAPPARVVEETESEAVADLLDATGDIVSRVRVLWRLRPG
jgi:acyl-coenzyme A thioesterase PaaI-like protein